MEYIDDVQEIETGKCYTFYELGKEITLDHLQAEYPENPKYDKPEIEIQKYSKNELIKAGKLFAEQCTNKYKIL